MIDRFEQFSYAISTINGYIQKIERQEMAKYGLKGAFSQYLIAIYRNADSITSAQLGRICFKDKGAVSRAVSELLKSGLLERVGENNNLYNAKLKLTEKGKKAAHTLCEKASFAAYLAGEDLSCDEREVFYSALNKISLKLENLSKGGIPSQMIDERGEEDNEC